jgi:hypothetical protein
VPQFVILSHNYPHLHWDLLIEEPGREMLRTWRLKRPPGSDAAVPAEALPDHRRMYLDYEGPISGGRGEVQRWDFGEYEALSETEDQIEIRLSGRRIAGDAVLTLQEGSQWTFQFTGSE